jgi:tripartite ATP-independent transporter DctP family solute receptor
MTSKQIKSRITTKRKSSGCPLTRRNVLKGGLALGTGLTACTLGIIGRATAAPITMRFGSDSPIGAPHTKSAVALKELIEGRTSGRIQVTIYPDGQLGGNGPMMNSVKTGSLDAVVADMSHISAAVPETDVFNLPFLYRDVEQVLRFAKGPIGARLIPKINEAFGCEVLGFATDGSRNLWNNKRPVRTPADMVGLKMAVGASKIQRDTILAFGAIPTVVELTAVYTALQAGLVEGTDKTLADMIELKLYQLTKYMTITNHFSLVNLLIVSKKFMDKLSPEDQATVRAAGQPAVDAQIEATLNGEKNAIAFLKEKEIQVLPMENPKAFSDRLEVVYKEAADRIGADIIDQARKFAAT